MNALVVSMVLALVQAPPPASAPKAAPGAPKPAPAVSAPAAAPVVVLDTTLGAIKIELDREKAPLSVDNFLKYVRAKHYDGTLFHRVMPGFMIQGGGLTLQGVGKDETMVEKATRPPIRNEAKNGVRNTRGNVAMARLNAPDTATSQFFINVKDNASLDFGINGAGYAVFGHVIEGMDVVDRIVGVTTVRKPPHDDVPATPVVIRTARLAK